MPRNHRIGWVLFLAASVMFGWAGVRSRDWVVLAGSVVFAAGCVLFLVESE